ncbi:fluoride efflux transporter CrcB [Kineococcus gynurae]|uniref:Fluoride-specific ion channel FluC n=1 Tax=Kineococcus gynurae TaxID=452979 RepID=A0ABV5LSR5_9ACTN
MSGWVVIAVAIAGGVGAVARFALDGAVTARAGTRWPLGTLLVNVSGSLVLGGLAGLLLRGVDPRWVLVLGTGFCGGFTTFSTAAVDALRLLRSQRAGSAIAYAATTLIASVAAAGAGFALLG